MTPPPVATSAILRSHNIALAFQEVFTVILRTRFNVQAWPSYDRMRAAMSQMIAAAAKSVRSMGYSDETTHLALYAVIGFVDENILGSGNPLFEGHQGRTFQHETFGNTIAGEVFFRNVADLLNRPESLEIAEILELHSLCLLLGFRGRFSRGDASEIDTLVRRIRQKIDRIRGPLVLTRDTAIPDVPAPSAKDRWLRSLTISTIALAVLALLAFLGYLFLLNQGIPPLPQAAFLPRSPVLGFSGASR